MKRIIPHIAASIVVLLLAVLQVHFRICAPNTISHYGMTGWAWLYAIIYYGVFKYIERRLSK